MIAYLITGSDRFTRFQSLSPREGGKVTQWNSRAPEQKVLLDPTLLIGPWDDIKGAILRKIDDANKMIALSVYMLTDLDVVDALIWAKQRWVAVQVMLEPTVYLFPKVNHKAYQLLTSAWVKVRYSSERDFNFNHSKYFLIDDEAIIGTGNMTKSSLLQNRELFVIVKAPSEVAYLRLLFDRDWEQMPLLGPENSLIIAPMNTRSALDILMHSAKRSITIMSPSLSDPTMIELIISAKARWVNIGICLPREYALWDLQKSQLKEAGVIFLFSETPQVHAKTLLIDDRQLLVGSANFTQNSIDRNREVGILIGWYNVVQRYNKIINADCKR
jgi:cardiolipin synthase A/B